MRPFLWIYGNLKRKMLCIYDGFFPYQVINGESARDEDIYIYIYPTQTRTRERQQKKERVQLCYSFNKKSLAWLYRFYSLSIFFFLSLCRVLAYICSPVVDMLNLNHIYNNNISHIFEPGFLLVPHVLYIPQANQ